MAHILGVLKKLEPELEKATRKGLQKLAMKGKRDLMANSPVGETGLLRRSWTVRNKFRPSKGEILSGVAIRWPSGIARYPFILEHGRPRGPYPLAARRYIAETRRQLEPQMRQSVNEIAANALRPFQ